MLDLVLQLVPSVVALIREKQHIQGLVGISAEWYLIAQQRERSCRMTIRIEAFSYFWSPARLLSSLILCCMSVKKIRDFRRGTDEVLLRREGHCGGK